MKNQKMNSVKNPFWLVLAVLLTNVALSIPAGAQVTLNWTLINQTQQTMTLVDQNIKAGQFSKSPPQTLSNNSHGEFEAVGRGVAGTLVYQLDNTDKTRFTLYFDESTTARGKESVSIVGHSNRYLTDTRPNSDGSSTHVTTFFEVRMTIGPEDCSEYFRVTIQNNSGYTMTLTGQNESHGKWVSNPTNSISNGGQGGFWASGVCGTWTGVQGSVVYQLNDADTTSLTIEFYKPFDGTGYYKTLLGGSMAGNYSVGTSGISSGPDNDHNIGTTTINSNN